MLRVRKQVYCTGGYTGENITAAVLDTGISGHPDFDSRIVGFMDFVNKRIGLYDDDSHGTHVSGILAGSGILSAGKYRGIAPHCRLAVGKVLNSNGDGSIEHMLQGNRMGYADEGALEYPDSEYFRGTWIELERQTKGISYILCGRGVGTGNCGSCGGRERRTSTRNAFTYWKQQKGDYSRM